MKNTIYFLLAFCCLGTKLSAQYALTATSDTAICNGRSVQLNVTGGTSYTWSPATGLSSTTSANPVATPTQTTTYVVTSQVQAGDMVINGNFSEGDTGFTSNYIYTLPPNMGGQQRYWVGNDPTSFSSGMADCPDHTGGGGNMLIANGSDSLNTPVWCESFNTYPNSTYSFSGYIQTLNQTNLPKAQWMVNGVPIGSVTSTYISCIWMPITATWNSGVTTQATFCIFDPDTFANGNDFALDDISITATLTLTDTVVITVANPPSIHLGSDTSFCQGQSLTLNAATPSASYVWSTGATSSSINVSASGLYWVSVNNGCVVKDSVQVAVISPPAAINLGADTGYCGSFSRTLSTGVASTIWSTGVTASQIAVSSPGTYWAADSNQCGVRADTIVISQNPAPVISLGADTAICSAQTLVLDAGNPGSTYRWSNAATTETIETNISGLYSVTVTLTTGCSAAASTTIENYIVPLTTSIANTTCGLNNGSATAVVTAGRNPLSFHWNTGSGLATIDSLAPGTYTVTVTDGTGCSASTSATINPSGQETIPLSVNKTSICSTDTSVICAPAGFNLYRWNNGDSTTCISTNLAGNYAVTVTDAGNCTSTSNPIAITVFPSPSVSISTSGDTLICSGGVGFQWFFNGDSIPGANGTLYVAGRSGDYSVVLTDSNGCSAASQQLYISTAISAIEAANHLIIYPNPLERGNWILQTDENMVGALAQVFNEQGQLVYTSKVEATKMYIDFTAAKGVYIIKITAGNKYYLQKLVSLKD